MLATLVRYLGDLPVAEDALSEATIAALEALARFETDRDRITELYDLLGSVAANPVVALNRAVAITERDGPPTTCDGLAGRQRPPRSWKPPPRWRPPRKNGGCLCPVSAT